MGQKILKIAEVVATGTSSATLECKSVLPLGKTVLASEVEPQVYLPVLEKITSDVNTQEHVQEWSQQQCL